MDAGSEADGGAADTDAGETLRFRLDIAYDGTNFSGWGRQPRLRTVQGEIEAALASIFRSAPPPPMLVVAGRTDAGVHATGQVAHVDLTPAQVAKLTQPPRGSRTRRPKQQTELATAPATAPQQARTQSTDPGPTLARRINGIFGAASDVVIRACTPAPEGFDARFSATWRAYRYRIADTPDTHDPLQRHRTVWVPGALDDRAMDAAAVALIGLHDFAAYCKPREGATTIRTLQDFRWTRAEDGVLVADVRADAFCHSMVRALVGGSVAVGEGRLPPERLVELLSSDARTSDFKVMPAKGLTLLRVGYPADDLLAARTLITRARRAPHERTTV
ncbi:tRNA pseudouridine synthase A [Planctomonas psychrotolerans]|uniref:tRNA pseudouridine synthase A n=1 Tax=Planctomonas psychrotolerans TaxID=2528712 RepID=UPI001239D40B|nr:tRNA pseudouridine synthase A [Planctomonas psychrotolerans]